MGQLVSTLADLARGVEAEQGNDAKALKEHDKSCKSSDKQLEKAIKAARRTAEEAQKDIGVLEAELASTNSEVEVTKAKAAEATAELDRLTAKLRALRETRRQAQAGVAASLRQVDSAIASTFLKDRSDAKQEAAARPARAAEMSVFQRLSSHFAPQAGRRTPDPESGASLLQTGFSSHAAAVGAGAVVQQLRADKGELEQAAEAARRGFEEEERELLELLRIQQEGLHQLQARLEELQPVAADRSLRIAETGRMHSAAQRDLDRDAALRAALGHNCAAVATERATEAELRAQLLQQLKMAAKLLEHADPALFLAGDLRGLDEDADHEEPVPGLSFLQLAGASAQASESQEAMRKALGLPSEVASVPEGPALSTALNARAPTQDLPLLQVQAEAQVNSGGGPFDGVVQMIEALVASLRNEGNEDVDRSQWCLESGGRSQHEQAAAKASIGALTSSVHWAKATISKLDDQITFDEAEVRRLGAAANRTQKDLDVEGRRVADQLRDHNATRQVVGKVVLVLGDLCHLGHATTQHARRTSALSQQRMAVHGSDTQCDEAAKLLHDGIGKLDALDQAIGEHAAQFRQRSDADRGLATEAIAACEADLSTAKGARARRAADLAIAEGDVKQKHRDLELIAKAKAVMEQSCSPAMETHEERAQRRATEIEALKNVLSVISGESVPI